VNHKILIVDDDELNLTILEEILEAEFELIRASNGVAALAKVRDERPALVLLDIMMPEMDGYEACRQIKAGKADDDIPHVILVSAKASTNERVRGYEVGADDYLIKPFDEDELLAKVRVQMRLHDALEQLDEARAALAADNRQLEDVVEQQTQDLTDTRELIVFAMAKLAESRDPETGEHLERMREYCRILAVELSKRGPYTELIDDEFINNIYRSSPLHDIGKVGVPDAILLKPGRLTNNEFEIMKQHAAIGAEALESVVEHGRSGAFLTMAIDIARHHHERWDGSGYPAGLSGKRIPLAARICALADVFDALTSVRVYKSAFTAEVARSMIVTDAGTHFDPAVVEAFEAVFEQFTAVRQGHAETAADLLEVN